MAKARKTVSIDALLDYANGYLSADYPDADGSDSVARRKGVIALLESALGAIDRYNGYSYLDETQITMSKPGIRWLDKGHTFENCDDTRRRYA